MFEEKCLFAGSQFKKCLFAGSRFKNCLKKNVYSQSPSLKMFEEKCLFAGSQFKKCLKKNVYLQSQTPDDCPVLPPPTRSWQWQQLSPTNVNISNLILKDADFLQEID